MALAGRQRELRALNELLDRADRGSGGVVTVVGPGGAGKTALADATIESATGRGFDIVRASPVPGRPGLLVWAQLLRDVGAPDELVTRLLSDPDGAVDPMALDDAARLLLSGRRLIVVDDIDHGGQHAVRLLSVLAGRAVAGSAAVVATSATHLGVGRELTLVGLTEDELATMIGPAATTDLWVASGGLPGVARALAADLPPDADPVVHLALHALSRMDFLVVDTSLVRLLELAAQRATDDTTRARVLARLARELLGDASTDTRRRALIGEAVALARGAGDVHALAEVLDSRLHAVWEPAEIHERLAIGAEIVELARSVADERLARAGLFWQFVALMELGRITEAEAKLAAFEQSARDAGDGQGLAMATARHGMLAALRGQFDDTLRLAQDVVDLGRRSGLADTDRLAGTLRGLVMVERDLSSIDEIVAAFRDAARRMPGHFIGADLAFLFTLAGRDPIPELERVLPAVLAGSGPRWVGALARLAVAAAATGHPSAADIYDALLRYPGRLVVLGGANSTWGPVAHHLGVLAAQLGRQDDAVKHFTEAITLTERIGALPALAHSLAACADVVADPVRASDHRRRARSIAERLGMTVLLDRLARPADEWTLDRDGEDWLLTAGAEQARLRDSRGMHYLRALLAAPGQEIPALDLVAGGAGLVATAGNPLLDDAAVAAYRRRIAALDTELDHADQAGDRERATRATSEREAILAELRRTTGLGGRQRQATAEAERARVNATRTIRAAINRIGTTAPRAAAHLNASIHTGSTCRYQPTTGGPTCWHV